MEAKKLAVVRSSNPRTGRSTCKAETTSAPKVADQEGLDQRSGSSDMPSRHPVQTHEPDLGAQEADGGCSGRGQPCRSRTETVRPHQQHLDDDNQDDSKQHQRCPGRGTETGAADERPEPGREVVVLRSTDRLAKLIHYLRPDGACPGRKVSDRCVHAGIAAPGAFRDGSRALDRSPATGPLRCPLPRTYTAQGPSWTVAPDPVGRSDAVTRPAHGEPERRWPVLLSRRPAGAG